MWQAQDPLAEHALLDVLAEYEEEAATMQPLVWPDETGGWRPVESASLRPADPQRLPVDLQRLPVDLQRVACGAMPLPQALQTIATYQEEQAHTEADVLAREVWTVTTILAASTPLWQHPVAPTLSFLIGGRGDATCAHLEVGRFAHLAALPAPTAGEQELIGAETPCWARVRLDEERLHAGQTGALACSYVPITVTEAVAALGLGPIVTRFEAVTRAAGQTLLSVAQLQEERRARVERVEQQLGEEADPVQPQAYAARKRMRQLLESGSQVQLALTTAYVYVLSVLIFFVIDSTDAFLALLLAIPALLLWRLQATR